MNNRVMMSSPRTWQSIFLDLVLVALAYHAFSVLFALAAQHPLARSSQLQYFDCM